MNEDFEDCAQRELLEETGLEVPEGFTFESVTNDIMTSESVSLLKWAWDANFLVFAEALCDHIPEGRGLKSW